MTAQQYGSRDGQFVREYRYDDHTVVVADLGGGNDLAVDVVDGTAIVASPDGSVHDEIDLPSGDAEAFIRNGVLTIEITDENA